MKITKTKLVEIIKEELDAVLGEEEKEGSGEERTEKFSAEEEEWLENLEEIGLQEEWEDVYVEKLKEIPDYVEDRHDEAADLANADLISRYYLKDPQS